MKYKVWIDKQNYTEFNSKDDLIKFIESIKNDNIVIEIQCNHFLHMNYGGLYDMFNR